MALSSGICGVINANGGMTIDVIIGLFLALTWIFVLLRAYVKTCITKNWAVDDLLLGFSQVSSVAFSAGDI